MKRCCSLLLMVCLTCGVGFPLFAKEKPGRFAMEEPHKTMELQNIIEPQNMGESQNPEREQNRGEFQNTTRLQNLSGESQNGEEPQDKTKIKLTENRLIIENLPEDEVLEIYNIMGMKVYNRRVKAGTNQYILSLPKGYYIIKIGKLTRKIAIK